MTRQARHELRWNWPHLATLVGLIPFAWLSGLAAWEPGTTLTLGTLLALAWLMFAERRWPARSEWTPCTRELLRDGAFLGINAVVDAAGALVLTWLALVWAAAMPGPAANWSPWIAVPVAVVLGELGPYVLHRWAHRGGWGWQVHAVHHLPERLNASNNLTTHPINVLWNQVARMLPWTVLGFDAHVIAWAALFIQVQSFAVHANIAGTVGPLSRWIGSAELHRWHHSVVQDEALNFSTALPIWDRLFGTYQAPAGSGPAHVGIADLPGGAEWALWRRMFLAPFCFSASNAAREGSRAACLRGCKQCELTAREQLSEVSVEAHEVLTPVRHGRRQPGIGQVVARQLFVEAQLPELRPLRAQGRELHAGRRQDRVDERHGICDRGGKLEDLRARDQPQETCQHHRHQCQ